MTSAGASDLISALGLREATGRGGHHRSRRIIESLATRTFAIPICSCVWHFAQVEDTMPNRIPLDPKLPKAFDATPNDARSKAQFDAWWDRPYGLTRADGRIEVRCLNGGAWDRSTHLGIADNYDAACALAEEKQAQWLKFRERPCVQLDLGQVLVVRQPQRPDEAPRQLAAFPTAEAATDYLHTNFPAP